MAIALTQALIDRTLKQVANDRTRQELHDLRAPGLFLRVQPRGSKWGWRTALSGKTIRLDLGPLDEWTLTEARVVAGAASAMIKSRLGVPTSDWLHQQRIKHGKIEPEIRETATNAREFTQWTFAEGRDAYLAEVRRTLRPATYNDYRHMLHVSELDELQSEKIARITRLRLASIVATVHQSGRERYAGKLADTLRPMWRWLGDDAQTLRSGVEAGVMERLKAPAASRRDDSDDDEGRYVPPLIEVGRILAMSRILAFDPQIGTAIALLCYAVQRRRAIVSARIREFVPIGDGSEGLWRMPPAHRKTADKRGDRRHHVVPLPLGIWAIVQTQIERADGSEWLFPAFRPKRAGGAVSHMNESILTRGLLLMPGITASPHDLRRAFATHGEAMLGWSLADSKAILDHNEGVPTNDVTRESYALGDGTHFKWPIMKKWAAAIETAAGEAVSADPLIADRDWLKREIDNARYGERA